MAIFQVTIDGAEISSLSDFYNTIYPQITKDLDWIPAHNMDALADILRGGFGQHQFGDSLQITWKNFDHSRASLGYQETLKWIEAKMYPGSPYNQKRLRYQRKQALACQGITIGERLLAVLRETLAEMPGSSLKLEA